MSYHLTIIEDCGAAKNRAANKFGSYKPVTPAIRRVASGESKLMADYLRVSTDGKDRLDIGIGSVTQYHRVIKSKPVG